ncbi:uncharacterized protein TNCV_2386471 [Trichonephila clavipes]|nr:uncharacterized protein TNCV_2386471 [Trichonephila clavipes]
MATHILSRQGQSQTNAAKAQDYDNSVLGPARFLLVDFMPQGATINSGAYCAVLWKLRRALQNKQRGMLSKGVLLLHDNAWSHTSRMTLELIESFGWEVLDMHQKAPTLLRAISTFSGTSSTVLAGSVSVTTKK